MRRLGAVTVTAALLFALLPVTALAGGPGWAIKSTTDPSGSQYNSFRAISCTAAKACTAVGDTSNAGGTGSAVAQRWNGSKWTAQTVPLPAGAIAGTLQSVSCSTATSCIAAGYGITGGGTRTPLAERWDGSTWTVQSVPNPSDAAGSVFLRAVSCTSSTACVAVGDYATGGLVHESALAEVWNGTSWTVQPTGTASNANSYTLDAVSCTSTAACMAVGEYVNASNGNTYALAERWNGTAWTALTPPNLSGQGNHLLGVSCVSATACVAVGWFRPGGYVGVAEIWDGASWQPLAVPPLGGVGGVELDAVSCVAVTACTAVGVQITGSGTLLTLAEQWDGAVWANLPTPNPVRADGLSAARFHGVACTAAAKCNAVGYDANSADTASSLLAANGTSWTIQPTPLPSSTPRGSLTGSACASKSMCFAVGTASDTSGNGFTLAERWNGKKWKVTPTVNPSGASSAALGSVACPSSTACVAVGYYRLSSGAYFTLVEAWNGTSWSVVTSPNPSGAQAATLGGVSCTSASACTATGYYFDGGGQETPLAERWNGTAWSLQTAVNPSGALAGVLRHVSCTSSTACTAAGYYEDSSGTILPLAERWNGTAWSIQSTPIPSGATSTYLFDIACTADSACTAVGDSSDSAGHQLTLAERWNGSVWSIQTTANPNGSNSLALQGVSCWGASACTAVGYVAVASTLLTLSERWNGTTWTVEPTPSVNAASSSNLAAVSCVSATACAMVGFYNLSGGNQEPLTID